MVRALFAALVLTSLFVGTAAIAAQRTVRLAVGAMACCIFP